MADKSIFELDLQTTFATNDRLVVGNYANSDAEAITGQTLVNLLATMLDGHGGIQSIAKTGSSGTDPVVDVYTITLADQTTTTFSVTNGLKGDTGAQTFVYFRWAHTQPSSWSDTTDQPDEWMGVYAGTATTPPTTVNAYAWVKVRGDKGDTGDASTITTQNAVLEQLHQAVRGQPRFQQLHQATSSGLAHRLRLMTEQLSQRIAFLGTELTVLAQYHPSTMSARTATEMSH